MRNGPASVVAVLTAATIVVAINVPRQGNSTTGESLSFVFVLGNEPTFRPLTCQPLDIHWTYTGPEDTFDLFVTNFNVPQTASEPLPSSTTAGAVPQSTLSSYTAKLGSGIDPTTTTGFRWPSVNVTPGWYIFTSSIPALTFSVSSDPFYVHVGSDTSCILNSTSSTPLNTSGSSYLTTSSSTSVPVASHSNSISIGGIVGACVALTLLVGALLLIFLWFKKSRNKNKHRQSKAHYTKHWGDLNSSDSRNALRASNQPYHQSAMNSLGTVILSTQSEEEASAEKASIYSKLDSSGLSCEHDGSTLCSIPALNHQSSQSRGLSLDRPLSSPSASTLGLSNDHSHVLRRGPSGISNRHSLNSVVYPPLTRPTAARSSQPDRDQRASTQRPNTTYEDPRLSVKLESEAVSDSIKLANRQSFGRKRKPVPAYEEDETSASPSVPPPLPTSPTTPPSSSSPQEALLSSTRTSSNIGHYVTRNSPLPESGQPDLGSKPVHYLIPDMPLPQK